MSPQRASPATATATAARFDRRRRADAPTPPRWLGLAQVAWAVTAILALGVLVASIPGYVLIASQGDWAGRVVAASAGLVRALDLAGALASVSLWLRPPGRRLQM